MRYYTLLVLAIVILGSHGNALKAMDQPTTPKPKNFDLRKSTSGIPPKPNESPKPEKEELVGASLVVTADKKDWTPIQQLIEKLDEPQ